MNSQFLPSFLSKGMVLQLCSSCNFDQSVFPLYYIPVFFFFAFSSLSTENHTKLATSPFNLDSSFLFSSRISFMNTHASCAAFTFWSHLSTTHLVSFFHSIISFSPHITDISEPFTLLIVFVFLYLSSLEFVISLLTPN